MAKHGEWNQKGASFSDKTAKKEYGVRQDFIVTGIQAGHLEYKQGSVWGNPYFRILRSQLESYVVLELGADYLVDIKRKAELQKVKMEITSLKKRLRELETRKGDLESETPVPMLGNL